MGSAVSASITEAGIRRIRHQRELDRLERLRRDRVRLAELRRDACTALVERQRRVRCQVRLIEAAQAAAKAAEPRLPARLTMRSILDRFVGVYGVTRADLIGPSRNRRLVLVRQAAMYWMRRRLDKSWHEIGRFFGERDHTTVLHAVQTYPGKRAKAGRHVRVLAKKGEA